MRYLIHLALLLSLVSTQALASGTQLVELIIFRQDPDRLLTSRVAPDDWAKNSTVISREMQRSPQLSHLVSKLKADPNYQILLHQAWQQSSNDPTVQVAIHAGEAFFDHYPVEGRLAMQLDRTSQVQLDFWINQFNPDATLLSSERFKQSALVANDQITFIDHGSLAALIRIQAQKSSASPEPASANEYME